MVQKNRDSHLAKALPLSTSFNEVLLANSVSYLVICREALHLQHYWYPKWAANSIQYLDLEMGSFFINCFQIPWLINWDPSSKTPLPLSVALIATAQLLVGSGSLHSPIATTSKWDANIAGHSGNVGPGVHGSFQLWSSMCLHTHTLVYQKNQYTKIYKSLGVFQETPKRPQLSGSQSMVCRSLGVPETCYWSPHGETMFIIISTTGTINR